MDCCRKTCHDCPAELVHSRGGSYATALGIDLASVDTGYLRHGRITSGHALEWLQQVWTDDGQREARFADFEATLVREGLRLRREESRHGPSGKETI
jgi:hypothetical protein